MKRVPRTNSRYPFRSRGGRGGNREHSAPATATPPTSEVRHPSQLLPEQRHVHLVEVKYCDDTTGGGTCEAPPHGVPWKRVRVLCKYTLGHTRERQRPHTLAAE
eukprot:421716-Pelagomonas_calceolata.AAC.1